MKLCVFDNFELGLVNDSALGFKNGILEMAPLQWGEWQRHTLKWWPDLFSRYNISLSGRYITFVPPIVLNVKV